MNNEQLAEDRAVVGHVSVHDSTEVVHDLRQLQSNFDTQLREQRSAAEERPQFTDENVAQNENEWMSYSILVNLIELLTYNYVSDILYVY